MSPVTGFYRTGLCEVGPDDLGIHAVCIVATEAFLVFSKAVGNDLSTPNAGFGFPGLREGDKWCLCAERWKEAYDAGSAPQVVLSATHELAANICGLDALISHGIDTELLKKKRRH